MSPPSSPPEGFPFEQPQLHPTLHRDPDFDQALDEEGDINIRGCPFHRSEILATDAAAYRGALAEWKVERRQSLYDEVFESFPFPIAHCLYRFVNSASHPAEKLGFLKDTWEASIVLLHAICLAEMRGRGQEVCVRGCLNGSFAQAKRFTAELARPNSNHR